MFRLLRIWDADRELAPEDFQFILSPREAFSQARLFYEISSDRYHYPDKISCHDVPRRKGGCPKLFSEPDERRRWDYADEVYDDTQRNIDQGWIIGIDTQAQWNYRRNPFSFDEKSNLIYECFMGHYHRWFESEVRRAYEKCLNIHRGRKPAPTFKRAYDGNVPVQHAQAAKAINSKAAGVLLAAGGVYNGNIEGYQHVAEQFGGDTQAGYDLVMDHKSLLITGTSVAAGLGLGRLGAAGEIQQLGKIVQTESVTSRTGTTIAANGQEYSIEALSQSGRRIDPAAKSGNFTVAGRALQKHGSREGSAFPAAGGNPAQINEQGQQILNAIITPSGVTVKQGNRFGGFDVISSDGKGSRFDSEGNFRGFLEP